MAADSNKGRPVSSSGLRLMRAVQGATLPMRGGAAGDQLRRNMAVAAGLCGFAFIIILAFSNYFRPPTAGDLRLANIMAVVNVALSLSVVMLSRWQRLNIEALVDMGLIYMVAQALGISLAEIYATYDPFSTVRGVSWVCVWIIAFQLVVPTTPGKALLSSLGAATTGPVALLIAIASGVPHISLITAVSMVLPNYFAAGVAVVLSGTLYRLREDVSRAEMAGSYRMIERLGEGGMGEVWRAEHDMLARPAAVKLIKPQAFVGRADADIETIFRRFRREAEATANLTSEHTVRVFDFGRTDEGILYYVMELLDGTDLETMVAEGGPLPPARVVHLLQQACDSLAEAHAAGMVHRDIKPANIYVCRLGTIYDRVKVLDFGLVTVTSSIESAATRLTKEGTLTGTPAYMAPEIVRGGGATPDARVDVYALGCVAYWLLTGKMVFEGSNALAVVYGHVEREPVPPSTRAGVTIPAPLEKLVLDCLAKDPDARPADAAALAERLAACDVDPWTESQARSWWLDRAS